MYFFFGERGQPTRNTAEEDGFLKDGCCSEIKWSWPQWTHMYIYVLYLKLLNFL